MNTCDAATFKRGASFKFIFKFPAEILPGHFAGWTPTAQLRKFNNTRPDGLIAQIPVQWSNTADETRLSVDHPSTATWPLGLAEFDVVLTSPTGEKVTTGTILFDIQRGITQ